MASDFFGNGERTGNVDIVTLAMNMYSHGVAPGLDFSNMPRLVEKYEKCTGMRVYDRAPYAGSLVFAAFSGSHQDAIAKGMKYREENSLYKWNVPYMPIDPCDISRTYDADVIRVNSQSGKGGIGYLLEHNYGYSLPAGMREALSYICKGISDREHRELKPTEVLDIFKNNYFLHSSAIAITDMHFHRKGKSIQANITFSEQGFETDIVAVGNGSLDAVSNALKCYTGTDFVLDVYTEHSMQEKGSGSVAAAYIGLKDKEGNISWGVGTDTDIIHASATALLSAYHNMNKGDVL